MLFGSDEIQSLIFSDLKRIEEKYDVEIIIGATVAGIEFGISKYSSDIDIRFCFIYKNKTVYNYSREEDIRIQEFYPARIRPYDSITIWEIHAFIKFLIEPKINTGLKYRLSSIVYETFKSPYLYDKYGVADAVNNYLDLLYPIENEISHLRNEMRDFLNSETFYLVKTIKIINIVMRYRWIRRFNKMPPLLTYEMIGLDLSLDEYFIIYQEKLAKWSNDMECGALLAKDILIPKPSDLCLYIYNILDANLDSESYNYKVHPQKVVLYQNLVRSIDLILANNKKKYFWQYNKYLL